MYQTIIYQYNITEPWYFILNLTLKPSDFRISSHSASNSTSVVSDELYLGVHGALVSTVLIAGVLQALFYALSLTSSAKRLHNTMFARLLRAPIKFFDTHPSGICNMLI